MARRNIRKNSPTVDSVGGNPVLTNVAMSFAQSSDLFFAHRLFPDVSVNEQSGRYNVWDRADANRDSFRVVGPSSQYPMGEARLSKDAYACNVLKYSEMISDEARANSSIINLQMKASERVALKAMLRRDRHLAENFFKTGVWTGGTGGTDVTPSTKWDNASTNPIPGIKTEIRLLQKKAGLSRRNIKMLLTPEVFDAMTENPIIFARWENVQPAMVTEQMIAQLLGIGEVIVGESIYATSEEGSDTPETDFVLSGEKALLVAVTPSPSIDTPSAGYTFTWTGLNPGGLMIDNLDRRDLDSLQVKGRQAFDMKATATDLGVFFDNVLT